MQSWAKLCMPRDSSVYLEDILEAIARIRRYTRGLSREAFADDERTLDAVVRNLEVIGEAVKQLPADVRSREPAVAWQKIAGLRDILIHQYVRGIERDGRSSPSPRRSSLPDGPASRRSPSGHSTRFTWERFSSPGRLSLTCGC